MIKRFLMIVTLLTLFVGSATSQDKLTLEDAIAIGLQRNYGIMLSRLDSDIANEKRGWGAAGAYPTISATGSYDISKQLLSPAGALNSGAAISLDGSLTLFDGFDIRITKRVNDYKYQLSRGIEAVQIENVIYDITLAYYNHILSKELLTVNKIILELSKDRYDRDKMSHELGGESTYDLVQSESAYLADQQSYINQERVVRESLYALNLVMGVEINKQWVISTSISVPNDEYALGTLLDRTMNNNSTLKNQYINQRVLEDNITLEEDYMPKVDVVFGGAYDFTKSGNPKSTFQPYAGIRLTANIFAGGMNKRNVRIANINVKAGEVTIEQMKQAITSTLMQTLDEYNYNRRLHSIAKRSMEVAEINLNISKEKFANRSITSFDYRIVQMEYVQQSYNLLKVNFDILRANAELCRLSGGMINR